MALPRVFTIEPNPHWVIIDNFSKLPDGAAIYTYRSLDPSVFKPAFQDAAGQVQYGQPIVGFGNGTMPPIYWEFDPNFPEETYYIRVYDSADPTVQQFLWDFDGLSGGTGGGGGTVISATDLDNLITNNIFFRNTGTQAPVGVFSTIAPSNNAGFVGSTVSTNGSPSPDITFQKNNTTATDSLSFMNFYPPLGINELLNDVTPELFVRYTVTVPGSGETYKYIQFPVSKGVQSLSQQETTIKIYARLNSGDPNLTLWWRQFYGDGGGSAEQRVIAGAPLALIADGAWHPYLIHSNVPDATGNVVGACGNDGLFLQVEYPLDLATSIDFIKPAIYLGNVAPGTDFVSNDEVDSIVNSPRTGDVRIALNRFMPGWVPMDDGTIGGAASTATTRANIDTYPLFNLLWNQFQPSPTLAPMFSNADPFNPLLTYGASPIADFVAGNSIMLTHALGRVLAGTTTQVNQGFSALAPNTLTVATSANFFTGTPAILIGGGIPVGLVANKTYYVRRLSLTTLSLYLTPEDAILNTNIVTFAALGSGNILDPAHTVGVFTGNELVVGTGAGVAPFGFAQPVLYMNFMIKL